MINHWNTPQKKDMDHPSLETLKQRQGVFQQDLVSQDKGYELVKHGLLGDTWILTYTRN